MNKQLPAKYVRALELLELGNISYKDIAKQSHIAESQFYDLIEGNSIQYGELGRMFNDELEKLHKRRDKEIRDLTKKNKKSTQYLIDRYLCEAHKRKKVDQSLISTLTSIANALSKSTPNVEIGSFSYTKGLSPEDIYAEFTRLSGLAHERGAIQAADSGRAGEIPLRSGSGSAVTQEPEDPIL